MRGGTSAFRVVLQDLLENWRNHFLELVRIFGSWKMTTAKDNALAVLHLFRGAHCHFWRTGKIIFAGQEIDWHLASDFVDLVPVVRINGVII